jgi:hypothetical protein
MAAKTLADLDFIGTFATRHRLEDPISSDPGGLGSGDQARVWFNTTSKLWKYWNGTAAIDPLARANHSGTQLSSTISDLATTVQAYRLDQFAAPTTSVSLNSQKITSLLDPTSAQDAASKNYVDQSIAGITGGLILKGAVVCASGSNINIASAPTTIDGITMSAGMQVLLYAQTTTTQQGVYTWASSGAAMARATNWATSAQAVLGSFWIVEQGTNADTIAVCTNDTAITIGTSTPAFAFRGAGSAVSGSTSVLNNSGTLSVLTSGAGIVGDATHAVALDFTVVGRKVTGAIPAATAGIFSITGAAVTINHGLSNSAPLVSVAAAGTPVAGYSTGDMPFTGASVVDANNVLVTLPANPATGNWVVTVIG